MAVATELARRLRARGHRVVVRDALAAAPAGLGRIWRALYRAELRWLPENYERTFGLYLRHPDGLAQIFAAVTGRRGRRWIAEDRPDLVVSTYSLASLVLGELRRAGDLVCPAVTYVTDLAAHPAWVHPEVDAHLVCHPAVVRDVQARSDGPVQVTSPLVDPSFMATAPASPTASGLPWPAAHERDRPFALVAAGSWGVGDVVATARAVTAAGHRAVVLCGHSQRLRRRVAATGAAALGWRPDVPDLLAGADVLIDNAGGQTALQAMAVGTPVVTARPIPGHGRRNAAAMAAAGVALDGGCDDASLHDALRRLHADADLRGRLVSAGRALFGRDAADDVLTHVRQPARAS